MIRLMDGFSPSTERRHAGELAAGAVQPMGVPPCALSVLGGGKLRSFAVAAQAMTFY
jgi:hypothetical protein